MAWWYGETRKRRLTWRRDFIRAYRFPPGLAEKLRRKHPNLSAEQVRVVEIALREFFLFYLRSGSQSVGMPSRVTDDLWHEFILDTRAYAAFCQQAFGHFFHHVPSGGLGQGKKKDAALRRTWRLACAAERMHPAKARKLPRLFGLDAQLAVAGGLVYSLHWAGSQKEEEGGCGGGACGGGGLASGEGSGCAGGAGCSGGGGCGGGGCGGG
ncbi:hypothetical protein FN976_17540 [Caenimonas sedimenti]|uniref:Uncharacterized protein n=1 Tax=Caenimonas sedimenti TaxID=2596921 RepID=A0A562ZNP6_9BURK|nr:hypothetical protein FN976_17540 [Caenimonas sedimenti]